MSNLGFKFMAAEFKIRDAIRSPKKAIKEAGIKPGFNVLDYGCGSGSYVLAVSELIGENGKLYALDMLPVAIDTVKKLAKKNKLRNVETILSDGNTGLPGNTVDVVLLYDAGPLHDLDYQNAILQELHRVLKPKGILSFSSHHVKEADIISAITNQNLFKLLKKGAHTYSFIKV